jgi:hypothetical protein
MDEIEKGLKEFLDFWFAGFMLGIDALDAPSRKSVLHACGKACAQSYTVQVFRDVAQRSADLDSFLRNLSERGSGSRYERARPDTIRVTYSSCGCDLVRLGLVRSPELCECSAANLKENFEQSWGAPVSVEVETSILRGGTQCVLIARLENQGWPPGRWEARCARPRSERRP